MSKCEDEFYKHCYSESSVGHIPQHDRCSF